MVGCTASANRSNIAARTLMPGRSGSNRRHGRHRSRAAQTAPPEECAGKNQRDARKLHERDAIVKHQCASGVAAEKFDGAAFKAIEKKIGAEELSGKSLAARQPHDDQEI